MKYNIFQDSQQLKNIVAKALNYGYEPENSWFTEDIYFRTFFYLSKRFGQPKILDEGKDAGTWNFKVKEYIIRISLNTSWVSFIVFGELRLSNNYTHSPVWVKMHRESLKKKDLILPVGGNVPKDKQKLMKDVFDKFCKIEEVGETWTTQQFKDKKGMKWFKYVTAYNDKIINIDFDSFNKKYGTEYSNSKTRHALKTLEQFLHNMLTPIWIRDADFNILGHGGAGFEKYIDNINIEFIK